MAAAPGHAHDHTHALTGRTLRTAFFLTAIILAVEVAGGLLSHSLALLSDAGHVLTDIVALGLAWRATVQAERSADAQKTYGYHRTGILAALANAVTLLLISLGIAVLIARGAWRILRETVDILMEATPKDVNVAHELRDVVRQPGIVDIHDLHIWSIAGGMKALSVHVQVADRPLSACDPLLVGLNRLLQTTYKIGHSTIQLERAGCNPNHLYCTMNPEGKEAHDHAHDGHTHPHIHDHEQTTDGLDRSVATSDKER